MCRGRERRADIAEPCGAHLAPKLLNAEQLLQNTLKNLRKNVDVREINPNMDWKISSSNLVYKQYNTETEKNVLKSNVQCQYPRTNFSYQSKLVIYMMRFLEIFSSMLRICIRLLKLCQQVA